MSKRLMTLVREKRFPEPGPTYAYGRLRPPLICGNTRKKGPPSPPERRG